MSSRLYVLCGPAFAGKTTLARAIVDGMGARYIGADAINAARGVFGGFAIPVAEWAECHRLVLAEVDAALAAGVSAVVDDTSCFRFLRDDLRAAASRHGAATLVVAVRTPAEEILARARRNELAPSRPGVDLEGLEAQIAGFEWPADDEASVDYHPGEDAVAWVARVLLIS